jgi:hypothetical protein
MSTWCAVSTVPAPSSTCGHSWETILIDSSAAGVLNTISAHGSPPSKSARAAKAAFLESSSATTGTIPKSLSLFSRSFMLSFFTPTKLVYQIFLTLTVEHMSSLQILVVFPAVINDDCAAPINTPHPFIAICIQSTLNAMRQKP